MVCGLALKDCMSQNKSLSGQPTHFLLWTGHIKTIQVTLFHLFHTCHPSVSYAMNLLGTALCSKNNDAGMGLLV